MSNYRFWSLVWAVLAVVGAVIDKGAVYVMGAVITSVLCQATADIIAAIEHKP